MSITTLIIVFGVIAAGFIYYWRLSHKHSNPQSLTFSNFFLGGGQVGAEPTHQTNWGLSLAFANAFWYFAFLAYHYGLHSFLYNLPWSLSIGYLGYSVLRYLKASKHGTVHGFLGHCFGKKVRVAAAIATSIGYFLNCGFEIFYSAHIFAQTIGLPRAELICAVILAAFCGLYCMTGGYRANLITDAPQNKFAVLGLLALVLLLGYAIYDPAKSGALASAVAGPEKPTIDFLIGVLVFTSFFNLVDMANWQSVAANGDRDIDAMSEKEIRDLRWSFYRSALKQMIAPSLLGALVGVFLRVESSSLADEQLFPAAFSTAFAGWNDVVSGLVVGLVLLGFLSATLSSADNYLLASAQTLANDVFYHGRHKEILAINPKEAREEAEIEFVRNLRRRLPIYAIGIVLGFAMLYYAFPNYVFAFQFIMYGTAICLLPSLWHALRALSVNPQSFKAQTEEKSSAAFLSIMVGIVFALVPFLLATSLIDYSAFRDLLQGIGLPARADLFQNLSPLFGITASTLVFVFHPKNRPQSQPA